MEEHADRLKPLVSVVRGPATCESKRVLINTLESHPGACNFGIPDGQGFSRSKSSCTLPTIRSSRAGFQGRLTAS